jgi:predicted lipoprotein with Yx(FWY)xxD motif
MNKLVAALMLSQILWTQAFAGAPEPVSLTTVVVNDEGEKLLANSSGNTLYVFDLDLGKPSSVCNGNCAEIWPPYIVNAAESATLQAPLGSVARDNTKLQLTYEGRPVYTYAFDRGDNADSCDGVGDVWHYIEIK